MKTEQGQQYHQHAIAMAILCLAPDDRSEPDTGNALSWLRSIEWVASPQEPNPYPEGSAAHYAFEHCVEVDYPTSTDCIDVKWLFKAYTYVPAPTQEDA